MPTPAPFERTRTQAWRAFASVLPRVLAVIFAVEALVMVVLDRLPPMRPGLEAAVDAATLSLLSAPLLWWWIVLPLRRRLVAGERGLEQRLAQMNAMHRLWEALARDATADEVCETVVHVSREALAADQAAVLLVDEDGEPEFNASAGASERFRNAVRELRPWGGADATGEIQHARDCEAAGLPPAVLDVMRTEGIRSFSVYPIRREARVLGYLALLWLAPHAADAAEQDVGLSIVRALALVLERGRRDAEHTRLARAVESTGDGVLVTDARGVIRTVNPAFTRITGWSAAEVVGRRPSVLRSPRTPAAVHAELWRTIRDGRTWSGRLIDLRRDGSEYHAWLTISPVIDEHQRVTGYVGVQRDVTLEIAHEAELLSGAARLEAANRELRAAKEAAEAGARAKAEFLAMMSHELRTPMNGVLGFTHLLGETELDAAQREYLATIAGSGRALLAIINDVLDFSRIEAGDFELEPVPFDPGAVAREVTGLMWFDADGKGLALHAEVAPDAPAQVVGDDGRMRQLLLNLVGNAIKFTEQGSIRVDVGAAEDLPGGVRVAVTDTGIGIPADRRRRLFEGFTQLDGSTTRRRGGAGLGLAICSRLVAKMGGTIGVRSEPGEGSTFWFTLPPHPPAAADGAAPGVAPAAAPAAVRGEAAAPRRVLVVDDNAVNRKLAMRLLERAGCAVETAENGVQAVDRVHRARFDLVLMDCHMPEMDGIEATRTIRATETGPRLPIVALTASAMAEDRERALAAGMDDFLTKPLLPEALDRCLERWAA